MDILDTCIDRISHKADVFYASYFRQQCSVTVHTGRQLMVYKEVEEGGGRGTFYRSLLLMLVLTLSPCSTPLQIIYQVCKNRHFTANYALSPASKWPYHWPTGHQPPASCINMEDYFWARLCRWRIEYAEWRGVLCNALCWDCDIIKI